MPTDNTLGCAESWAAVDCAGNATFECLSEQRQDAQAECLAGLVCCKVASMHSDGIIQEQPFLGNLLYSV